jgi:hypothetical protein
MNINNMSKSQMGMWIVGLSAFNLFMLWIIVALFWICG